MLRFVWGMIQVLGIIALLVFLLIFCESVKADDGKTGRDIFIDPCNPCTVQFPGIDPGTNYAYYAGSSTPLAINLNTGAHIPVTSTSLNISCACVQPSGLIVYITNNMVYVGPGIIYSIDQLPHPNLWSPGQKLPEGNGQGGGTNVTTGNAVVETGTHEPVDIHGKQ